jgi:rubredoxin
MGGASGKCTHRENEMATVIAYDDAKVNQVTRTGVDGSRNVSTPLLGKRGNPDLPLASLVTFAPGRLSTPHFHDVPQYQIMLGGRGKLGRHDIKTNSVHFSRPHTPYGPFTAADDSSLTCLIIRSRPDTGAQHDAEAIAQLNQMPDRNPWQVTHDVRFPDMGAESVMLLAVPELQDKHGLATYTLCMKPGTTALTPDPSIGEGLFVVVQKGSLIHDKKEAKAMTLVYVSNKEGPYEIRAGAEGLEGLIVRFPNPVTQSDVAAKGAKPGERSFKCTLCAFAYEEIKGVPEDGIAPGTHWEDVPEDWTCPDCAADKNGFELLEL